MTNTSAPTITFLSFDQEEIILVRIALLVLHDSGILDGIELSPFATAWVRVVDQILQVDEQPN